MDDIPRCTLCGEPMPEGETMFKFHGFSGPCPAPTLPRPRQPEELLAASIAELEAEQKRAFDALVVLGVPQERARSVSNGIEVLATRFRKSDMAQSARIAELEAKLTRIKNELRQANNVRDVFARAVVQTATGEYEELANERKRREAAEEALGAVVACHNSDPILIAREPGYRWHDVIKQAIAHFARYKD